MSEIYDASIMVQSAGYGNNNDVPSIPKSRPAVVWWTWIGSTWLLFWAYVLIRWVTGPYFTPVPSGPVPVPRWMDILFTAYQVLCWPILFLGFYVWIYKPWKRNRNIPLDGLLLVGFMFMSLQDSCSNYAGIWYTFNSHMWNMGSFVNDIPGWMGFGRPGVQTPWCPLFHPLNYPLGMFVSVWVGSRVMDWGRRRFNWGPVKLILFLLPFGMLYDLLIEGAFQTLGFYTMAGGQISFFPDTYEKFPLIELPFVALIFVPVVALCYFKNDKGETLVERGINSIVISDGKKQLMRLLSIIGAIQTIYLCLYNIPVAFLMGANPGQWPEYVQSRPYFNDGYCGAGTGRLCPGPGVPLTQVAWVYTGENDSAANHISRLLEPAGKGLRAPAGQSVPPFDYNTHLTPFHSRFIARVSDRPSCKTLFCWGDEYDNRK